MGVPQSVEGLSATKRQRKGKFFSLLEQGLLSSHGLENRLSWILGLQTWAGTQSVGSLLLRVAGLKQKDLPGLPGTSAGRRQEVGLLSPRNGVSQSLIINLFLRIYKSILLTQFFWRTLIQVSSHVTQS